MDHARALGDAAHRVGDAVVLEAHRHLLGHGVGRHDRVGEAVAAVFGGDEMANAGPDAVHRNQPAGDAGAGDDDVLDGDACLRGGQLSHLLCVAHALLAGERVGAAGVDDDGLRLPVGKVTLGDADWRPLKPIGGVDGSGGAALLRDEKREVKLARDIVANAGGGGPGPEAARRGDGAIRHIDEGRFHQRHG